MPFAPIVRVNNHGQTILFGCALLKDETTRSFVWFFETFLNAVRGNEMKTIFTDQATPISNDNLHGSSHSYFQCNQRGTPKYTLSFVFMAYISKYIETLIKCVHYT